MLAVVHQDTLQDRALLNRIIQDNKDPLISRIRLIISTIQLSMPSNMYSSSMLNNTSISPKTHLYHHPRLQLAFPGCLMGLRQSFQVSKPRLKVLFLLILVVCIRIHLERHKVIRGKNNML
jgi:hypothetical protein